MKTHCSRLSYRWIFFPHGIFGKGFGIYFLLELCELGNRTVAGVFPEQSWLLKETPNSEGCFWQWTLPWGLPACQLGGRKVVQGFQGRAWVRAGNTAAFLVVCAGKKATFPLCTCRHWFILFTSLQLLPSTGCGHCQRPLNLCRMKENETPFGAFLVKWAEPLKTEPTFSPAVWPPWSAKALNW